MERPGLGTSVSTLLATHDGWQREGVHTGGDAPCACSLVAGSKVQKRVDIGTGWLSVLEKAKNNLSRFN